MGNLKLAIGVPVEPIIGLLACRREGVSVTDDRVEFRADERVIVLEFFVVDDDEVFVDGVVPDSSPNADDIQDFIFIET